MPTCPIDLESVAPGRYPPWGWPAMTLTLSATFNSIAAEVPATDQTGLLEFKRTTDPDWTEALPAWTAGGVCRGSALLCDAGTSYDVRITVDGAEHTGTITTRAEYILPADELVPTHFVRLDGSDANDGATPATAWATIRRALQASPSGAVVQVGSGEADEFFTDSGYATGAPGPRTAPITLVAHTPAVNANGQPINQGHRTFIEGSIRAAPTGQAAEGMPTAPWQQVQIGGHAVWRWAGAVPSGTLISLGYNQNRTAVQGRLWHWDHVGDRLQTPEGWSELLHTNLTFRYGFYQDGSDLYARLPNDGNPNTRWWTGSTSAGVGFNSPDSRISGFVFRGLHFAIRGGPGSDRLVVDRNEFQTVTSALRTSSVLPDGYPSDIVVERNFVRNTGLWSDDQAATPSAPWNFVKQRIKLADGSLYGWGRIGGRMEGSAVIPVGSFRTVVRRNVIEGTFDGIGTVNVASPSLEHPHMNAEWEIHDNVLRKIADDPYEPARRGTNWRIYRNRNEQTTTFMSTGGPTQWGPVYIFGNTSWRVGIGGLAPNFDGTHTGAVEGFQFKYDGTAAAGCQARFYVVGNTFWSDRPESLGGQNAAGEGNRPMGFWLRNNLFRAGGEGFQFFANPGGCYDEDYNQFLVAGPGVVMSQLAPSAGWASFPPYQAATGLGAHSNVAIPDARDVVTGDAQFVSPTTGNLALVAGSVLRGAGCVVANLAPVGPVDLGAP